MNNVIYIKIATDFTQNPGPRLKKQGPKSGEEFREIFLEPYFENPENETKLIIDLDGTIGYAPSFLEETFGGLVRKYGRDKVINKIEIRASEKIFYKELSNKYIANA